MTILVCSQLYLPLEFKFHTNCTSRLPDIAYPCIHQHLCICYQTRRYITCNILSFVFFLTIIGTSLFRPNRLKRKEHLDRHLLGHQEVRPHVCSECGKGFKRKEHLNIHRAIHSGDKSQVCPLCQRCRYTYFTRAKDRTLLILSVICIFFLDSYNATYFFKHNSFEIQFVWCMYILLGIII